MFGPIIDDIENAFFSKIFCLDRDYFILNHPCRSLDKRLDLSILNIFVLTFNPGTIWKIIRIDPTTTTIQRLDHGTMSPTNTVK